MLDSLIIYNKISKQKKVLDDNLVNIGLHAKGVSEYLINIDDKWHNLSQWFHIAHGIKQLNYDGINYDDAYFMCRPAYEYELERQILYKSLVEEITLFSYVYSGLEGIITELNPSKCPNHSGKINAATYFLKTNFQNWSLPIYYYDQTLRLCEKMFQLSIDKDYKVSNELGDCVSIHGLGLKMLYRVRNKLMHGHFFFPEPLSHSLTVPFEPQIINLCSRLILMSIQMLFLAFRKGKYLKDLEIYNSSIIDENEDYRCLISEKEYLTAIHIVRPRINSEQQELKLVMKN